MKLLERGRLRELWASGERIVRKGVNYRVGRMSYGDYFFEPGPDRGEREPFNRGTVWVPKCKARNA